MSNAISGQYQCNLRSHLFNGTYGFRSSAPGPSILLCLSRLYLHLQEKGECTLIFEHFCMHIIYLFMGMYGLSLFFLNMEPPALALAVLDLTMTGVFFSSELECNDGIWLYDERTPDRKRNFWSSLLLKRRS